MMSVQESSAQTPISLPVTCKLCLEIVADPWTCYNQHAFCQKCIKNRKNRCPVCSVEVKRQSPIRRVFCYRNKENESDRKADRELRKSRVDMVIEDYEAEIRELKGTIKMQNKKIAELVNGNPSTTQADDTSHFFHIKTEPPTPTAAGAEPPSSNRSCASHAAWSQTASNEEKVSVLVRELESLKSENERLREKIVHLTSSSTSSPSSSSNGGNSAAMTQILEAQIESAKHENRQLRLVITGKGATAAAASSKKTITLVRPRCKPELDCESFMLQPLSVVSVDESTNQSAATASSPRADSVASSMMNTPQKAGAGLATPPGRVDASTLHDDFDTSAKMEFEQDDASADLLRQFNESIFNGIDDLIDPASRSSFSSELGRSFFLNGGFNDDLGDQAAAAAPTTGRSVNDMYSSAVVDDVLLSQPDSKRSLFNTTKFESAALPTSKTTINAGSSRITMSRLSPEEQRLFNRPSSAPSKTFLLNSSLFSSIQPIDPADGLVDETEEEEDDSQASSSSSGSAVAFSRRAITPSRHRSGAGSSSKFAAAPPSKVFALNSNAASGFQPYKRPSMKRTAEGKAAGKHQHPRTLNITPSTRITLINGTDKLPLLRPPPPHHHHGSSDPKAATRCRSASLVTANASRLSKSPFNLVSPDEVMVNDRRLLAAPATTTALSSNMIATIQTTETARGKNLCRVNILKKGAAAPRTKRSSKGATPPPSVNTRTRRKQKLTEKRSTTVVALKTPAKR